jgi:hypothetical protein
MANCRRAHALWLPKWGAAERLIRGALWPAVQALEAKLWAIAMDHVGQPTTSVPDLHGDEAAAVVLEALAESAEHHGSDATT